MNRAEKTEFIEDLRKDLTSAPLVAVLDFKGATSNQANDFRRKLQAQGLQLVVVKNTLARLALEGSGKEGLSDRLTGMSGVVISGEDPAAAARFLKETLDAKHPYQVRAGSFDGETLDGDGVKKLADMPSKEQLQSMLLGILEEGPRQLLGVIQAPARDLLYLLKNYEQKLADSGSGE